MFLNRSLKLMPVVLSLCLFVGCGEGETGGPETTGPGGEVQETVESAIDNVEKEVTSEVEKLIAPQLDLTYITDDFTSAIIVHPARVLNSDLVKSLADAGLPMEEVLDKPREEFGIDPRKVDQIIVLVDKSTASMAPMMLPFGPPGGDPGDFGPGGDFGAPGVEPEPLEKPSDIPDFGSQNDLKAPLQPVNFQFGDAPPEGGDFEEPMPTIIVRFAEDIDANKFFSNPNAPPMEDAEVDGLKVKKVNFPEGVFYFVNPKTLIVTRPKLIKKMVDTKSAGSDLIAELKNVDPSNDLIIVADLTPLKPLLQFGSEMLAGMLPPDKAALASVPTKTKMVSITGGISNDSLLSVSLVMDSAGDASAVNSALTDGLKQAKAAYEQQKSMGLPPGSPFNEAEQKELIETADKLVAGISNKADGNRLTISIPKPGNLDRLVTLMKPAIDNAKKAAEQSVRKNKLKQIGLAFHNYHDTYNSFPGAGSDANGEKKGLSWRVYLLPFLDQAPLYNQFNLDEPWDSDTNKALIDQMPELFKTEGVDDPTKTSLHVFLGDFAFSLDKGKKIAEYVDGTSNSFLVVEAGPEKAEVWTKPGGLTLNEDDPLASLGELIAESFLALFADGSVRSIESTIDPQTLKALITINGGEVVRDF